MKKFKIVSTIEDGNDCLKAALITKYTIIIKLTTT